MVQRYDSQKYMAGMFLIGPKDDGKFVKYEDYAALKELTDKLVKLRRGGCMSFSEQKAMDDLLKAYKYD